MNAELILIQTPLLWFGFFNGPTIVPDPSQPNVGSGGAVNPVMPPSVTVFPPLVNPLPPPFGPGSGGTSNPRITNSRIVNPNGQISTIGTNPNLNLQKPPLIPRKLLLGTGDYAGVQISPDGRFLSYIADYNGAKNIWVAQIATNLFSRPGGGPLPATAVTQEAGRGISPGTYFWAYDNQSIIYMKDSEGDENYAMKKVDTSSGVVTVLISSPKVTVMPLAKSRFRPNQIVVGINDRDPRFHDPYLLDIKTGNKQLLFVNDRFDAAFTFDHQLNVKLGAQPGPNGGKEYYARSNNMWTLFRKVSFDDVSGTEPLRFDLTNQLVYWSDSTGRDKSALIEMNFNTRSSRVLYVPQEADVSQVLFDPTTETPVAVMVNYDRQKIFPLNSVIASDLQFLYTVSPGQLQILATSLDGVKWVVYFMGDDQRGNYYLYDRSRKQVAFLFDKRESLRAYQLARMRPVEIKTRDNLVQMCYLTLPPESELDTSGVPSRTLSMVLLVHGGPWSRDSWGFNAKHQLLANRGYAVLSCNFRGSTGFGKSFVNAGNKEWGGKMQADLLDAVSWAVNHKIATPGQVAIMGGSYGGYATLAALAFTPDAFACGVDVVGPSNLVHLLQSIPAYWSTELNQMKMRVGDPDTPNGEAFLRSRSPLFSAHRINKPLLIGQGANDPRVAQQESDQIVEAMKSRGLPVTYVLFPDEGHGFRKPANEESFCAVTELFLNRCLNGGRMEPLGNMSGSSIQVVEHGGLTELLRFKKPTTT